MQQQQLTNSENIIKVMIVNSQMKHKSKAMLGVIRHLMLDLVLYFIVLCPLHITST